MLNIVSGELSQASLHMTAAPGFYTPIGSEMDKVKKSRNEGIFKSKMNSIAPTEKELSILSEESRSRLQVRKNSHPVASNYGHSVKGRSAINYFSTY